jgi:hypothetical protein
VSEEEDEALAPEDLSDELARKYDPERLLALVSKKAGKGEALDHSLRSKYEARFGVDLSHVRIYTGEFAEELNRQRGAYALTIGSTGMILMGGSPEKSMASAAGQALLGHELTHVAQQAQGLHRKATFADAMPFAEEHEQEAELHEAMILHELMGGTAPPGSDSGTQKVVAGVELEDQIQQVKDRVLQMVTDTMRHQEMRNGSARRA